MGMSEGGTKIEPEGIVNINAGIIMLTCFAFAALGAKMRATTSLLVGTVLVVGALTLFGLYTYAWRIVGTTWFFFVGVGVVAAIMIYSYGVWIKKLAEREG